jgi:hypothetical protein
LVFLAVQWSLTQEAFAATPEEIEETKKNVDFFLTDSMGCKDRLKEDLSEEERAETLQAYKESKDALRHHMAIRNNQLAESSNSSDNTESKRNLDHATESERDLKKEKQK